jgi:hypothetical protein
MLRETFSCDDVLLVPRYSELPSRSVCDISSGEFGMPIISSPMDRVYSKELDKYLVEKEIPTAVHRYFNSYKEQLKASYKDPSPYRFFSVGSVSKYKDWIDGLISSNVSNFLIDMAHGDSKQCVDTVEYIKSSLPTAKIIAGNVATKSGFVRLEAAGAWAIRVGIGSGCFVPNTLITTKNGYKKIQDVNIGDNVLTHTGSFKEVIDTLSYERDEPMLKINNNITCTTNHEFYVVHKKYEKDINENNIADFAEWKRADELNEDYFIVEVE